MREDIEVALARLEVLGIAETYPYAAWVGAWLREQKPGWWQQFRALDGRANLPLAQAANYAFLQWCENRPPMREELGALVRRFFAESANTRQLQELLNTSAWYVL
jgi:hypothetical protein